MVPILVLRDPVRLSYFQAMLSSEGVEVRIETSTRPTRYRLFVRADDEARARTVIKAVDVRPERIDGPAR